MGYQPIEELLPRAGYSIFRLVRLACKRALEIADTGAKLIVVPTEQKITTTALEEIRQGKVVEKSVADATEAASGKKSK